jgi:hypothetical protein
MNDEKARQLILVLGGLLALVCVLILLVILTRGGESSATPSPSPSAPSASPSPSATITPPSPSSSASAVASASIGPSGSPSASPMPPASLTVIGLAVDPMDLVDGTPRVISFNTDQPGKVTAKLSTTGPKVQTHMCLLAGTKTVGCKDWTSGQFNGTTSSAGTKWSVTLISTKAGESPVVDVTLTFQSATPTVTVEHARFDGTAAPATNGITFRFVPRAAADSRLVAQWGGHPFIYSIDTTDVTSGAPGPTFDGQGPATGVDQTLTLPAPDTWQVTVSNAETGFGATDLTATISWP